ncbi:hypothetical protein ACS0TY_033540 [Phlomoides rotata]
MACRKGELREETRNRNDAASVVVGDALLFTMMCIIGMPVDVHAKDGSIYSGIFHTASVDEDYAIVLKKARMIKKGNRDSNVVTGTLIETLVIESEDLVQVVVKAVLPPSNGITGDGITGYVGEDGVHAASGYNECLDRDVEAVKPNKSRWNKKQKSQSRLSVKRENNFPNSTTTKVVSTLDNYSKDYIESPAAMNAVEIKEPQDVSIDERYVRDDSKGELQNNLEIQDKGTRNEVQGASPSNDTMHQEPHGVSLGSDSLEGQDQERATSDAACTVANGSVASISIIDVKSESCLSASSNPYILVPPKGSSVKRTTKESKLNPGAKMFSPSMLPHRTVTPPVLPNGSSDSYTTGTYTMAPMSTAQDEVNGSSFARSSMPVKFVHYNNVAFGRGGNDAPYAQPIIGQVVNRTQPVRYTGQYQNFSTGHTYVQPNPQNVMLGRVGPLVCMHPFSSDVVQSAAGFPSAASRPALTPHQVHLSKHQGNASAQALQLCMNPPIMANAPPSFVAPSSIPISQPVFPVLRQIAVPGANGFISSKLA